MFAFKFDGFSGVRDEAQGEALRLVAKGFKKILWREVAVKQPSRWWHVSPPKPVIEERFRWGVLAACVVGVGAFVGYKVYKRSTLTIKADDMMSRPESMIPGSELMPNGVIPDCQVKLAVKKGDSLIVVGSGVRVEDYLICPTHNVHRGESMYLVNKQGKFSPLSTQVEHLIAADVSAIQVGESTWSDLQIKRAKMGPLGRVATVTATSGCDNRYSVGTLKPSEQLLGRVVYTASTMPGFSGSVYTTGNVALGMHSHGGALGGGYELLYLWARLKHALDSPPEDSESFMLALADDYDYDHEDLGQNRHVIRTRTGHYHLTNTDTLTRMRKRREPQQSDEQLDWATYEPEGLLVPQETYPGESRRPVERANPGRSLSAPKVSSSTQNTEVRPLSERESLMRQLSSISNARLKDFLSSQVRSSQPPRTTSQQTPAHKQSGPVSARN